MAFSAMQNGWSDIFTVDLATEAVTNLTKDEIANYAPAYSPDGKSVVYLARISGNEKLFKLDLDSGKKTQLTFGTHDDAAAAVPRRGHADLRVDGDRPQQAGRAGSRAQRPGLQHLDAGPQDR